MLLYHELHTDTQTQFDDVTVFINLDRICNNHHNQLHEKKLCEVIRMHRKFVGKSTFGSPKQTIYHFCETFHWLLSYLANWSAAFLDRLYTWPASDELVRRHNGLGDDLPTAGLNAYNDGNGNTTPLNSMRLNFACDSYKLTNCGGRSSGNVMGFLWAHPRNLCASG